MDSYIFIRLNRVSSHGYFTIQQNNPGITNSITINNFVYNNSTSKHFDDFIIFQIHRNPLQIPIIIQGHQTPGNRGNLLGHSPYCKNNFRICFKLYDSNK